MMGVVDKGQVKGPVEVFSVKNGKAVKIYRGLLAQGGAARQFYSWGSGTEEDPYIIRTYADLLEMRHDLSAHYRLAATIRETNRNAYHRPIGTESEPFTGSLDGNGYGIFLRRKYSAEYGSSGGIFGVSAGTIKNLKVITCCYETTDIDAFDHFGMLAGVNRGTIENCMVTSGWKHQNTVPFGVVVGRNESGGVIRNVDCRIRLFPGYPVGKLGLLAGECAGTIDSCYADFNPIEDGNEIGYAAHTLEASGVINYFNTLLTHSKWPDETPFDTVVDQADGSICYDKAMKYGSNDRVFICNTPDWRRDNRVFWVFYKSQDPFDYKDGLNRCVKLRMFTGAIFNYDLA